jgi:hypothetical protein
MSAFISERQCLILLPLMAGLLMYFGLATAPVLFLVFLEINCAEIMKLLTFYDNVMNIYSH